MADELPRNESLREHANGCYTCGGSMALVKYDVCDLGAGRSLVYSLEYSKLSTIPYPTLSTFTTLLSVGKTVQVKSFQFKVLEK